MSDTVTAALEGLRERLRDLEMDAVLIRGRTEEVRDMIASLEHGSRRRGRPRKLAALEMPDRVEGAIQEPETEQVA